MTRDLLQNVLSKEGDFAANMGQPAMGRGVLKFASDESDNAEDTDIDLVFEVLLTEILGHRPVVGDGPGCRNLHLRLTRVAPSTTLR